MLKKELLKSQKNEVFELIKGEGLDPYNFTWSSDPSLRTPGTYVSRINYFDSEFFFLFDFRLKKHNAWYSPGREKTADEVYSGTWPNQLKYCALWLNHLRREIEQPDLWAEISKYQLPPGAKPSPDTSNEPFTVLQAEQILSGLNQVKAYIKEHISTTEQQFKVVNERLDYLAGAVRRLGRKDWIHTCIGAFVTIATGLALAPDQAQAIWNIIKDSISGIIKLLP